MYEYATYKGGLGMNLYGRDFLKLLDYTGEEIRYLLDLSKDLKDKQPGIKIDPRFNKIKKEMQKNEHCCKARYLDFVNKKGTHKVYYNSNFVTEFLKRYNDTV